MGTFISTINEKVFPALALETADESYVCTIDNSLLFKFWSAVEAALSGTLGKLTSVGTALQTASFALMVLMFFIIAAPQFANDKEGLAAIVLVAALLRVAGTLFGGRERYKPNALDGLVLAFFAINVIASFASHYLKESLFGLAKLLVYVIAYFLFTANLQVSTKKRSTIVLLALILGGFLVSIYGLWQFKHHVAPLATWEDPTVEDKATRVFSTLGNPNLLAGYLVPLIPISLCLSLMAVFAQGWKRWLSLPLLGITAVITAATFLTGSRGGYIGIIAEMLIVALVSIIWLWRQYPRLRIAILGALIVAPVLAAVLIHFRFPHFEQRFLSIFAGSEHSSNAYRLNVWRSSWRMFLDNWWIGIGSGNKTFRLAYGLYMESGFDALGTYCVPLEVAVETGIFGLLVFLWILLAILARGHQRFWQTRDPIQRWLAVAASAALVGMMAHGLVDTVFLRPQVQFVFWLAISILLALPPSKERASAV